MEIKTEINAKGGRFYIEKQGNEVAKMTFQQETDAKMNIDHTEVDESLQGQGVAHKLLDAAVAYAREHNLKVRATCSYAKSALKKNTDYNDVLI
ncbi:N-acetyltransferase [Subsaximicrobium wynnwilliamsii]|uniref:N-acetyltransferase n=1 Tax=Subsaximicrobium wynnwilliamsii TaxID=291179 RepID=A0A5C6ZH75_9FLAO|nr:GNAT family N-acetyltransferase [Subsaximicrobium wynnwilliamsii]TXD82971.1 N-acetyltransferase [Subsaximicrobium wynnwilliamsii]TXD88693.1 N-acetyltransferase [Subsaximicrobium wynnwilliamsii]TXE02786.1 N-acetyltransferase [Subsaximicrobium wynnwilliamsii]